MIYKIIAIAYLIGALALMVAKALGYIHGSWWIALIPIWLPLAIAAVWVIVFIVFLSREQSAGRNPFN